MDRQESNTEIEQRLAGLKRVLDKNLNIESLQTRIIPEQVVAAIVKKIVVDLDTMYWYLNCREKRVRKYHIGEPDEDEKKSDAEYVCIGTFGFNREDAIEYVTSFSPSRRVHKWRDIVVHLMV